MTMNRSSNDEAIIELKAAFAKGGIRGAVIFLNSLTDYRFTGLYLFEGDTLRNVMLYDREDLRVQRSEDILMKDSYCQFVRAAEATVTIDDTELDERLKNHSQREIVKSYCGTPLMNLEGKTFGTICHFDFKTGRIANLDVELLEYMSQWLQQKS